MPDADDGAVEGSDDELHFLEVPEVVGALDRMLDEFAGESDRGAVLVAADIVADTLGSVIEALRPAAFEASRLKQLMRYPGSIATFSARSDIAFLAGFIDATAHASIDKLRKLRNGAAHSQSAFNLLDHRDTLRAIADLGPGVAATANRMAGEVLMRSVVQNLLDAGIRIEAEIGSNPFSSPAEAMDELAKQPDAMEKLEGRLPRMELAFGVWLLLGLIRHKQRAMLAARAKPADA
jgi:hypothetical protein